MSLQNNANVRKYRARLSLEGCMRMEITLHRNLIKRARELAWQEQVPFWFYVERALQAYATAGNIAETDNWK